MDLVIASRKIERFQAKLSLSGIDQHQAGVLVPDQAAQQFRDGLEQLAQIQIGDHGIGNVEHHLQTIALARQFALITLRGFVVENILHRDGHLAGNLRQKFKIRAIESGGFRAAQSHRPQAPLRRGQWQDAAGTHSVVLQQLHDFRVAHLLVDIVDYQRLLGLPNQSGRRFVHRCFPERRDPLAARR